MEVAIYDTLTGQVQKMVRLGLAGDEAMLVVDAGDDVSHYVDLSGAVAVWQERPDLPASYADGVLTAPASAAWAAYPAGTEILLGEGTVGEDGSAEITFVDPGAYVLRLTLFPYRPTEVAVHVDAD
jgi:hypothetical protein